MPMVLRRATLAFACAITLSAPTPAATAVTKVDSFADWSLYADDATPHQFCFVTSEPKSSVPAGATREAPRIYISAWPQDGIKSEVSFRMGFAVKGKTDGLVTISAATFVLFGTNDRAFVADAIQELKLVDAMKKGAQLSVTVTSERGTVVTDTYSLAGLGQALQKLQGLCF